ncbi:hypothetical protein F5Y19DRAFT_443177 [Xylariaceae sp. FL1651]|nr:hypothetical protein F5Y19DRAFT_443177 [Xylariaceae sp. FL1651]
MVTPEQVLWIEWSTLIVTYTLVGLRIAVRLAIQEKKLLISDLLLFPAALCIFGLNICDTITYRMGAMENPYLISESLLKVQYATAYLFDIGMYFPKLSMLAFYFHLFPLCEVLLRKALYIVTVFVTVSAVATLFLRTFWCGRNPSANWATDSSECSSFKSFTIIQINWALCFTSELLIFILPFFLLKKLRTLVGRERLGIILVFALGVFTLITSIARFGIIAARVINNSLYLWPNGEFSVSIMVAASTALRPLLRKFCSCTLPRRTLSKGILPLFSLETIPITNDHGTKRNTSSHSADMLVSRDVTDAEVGASYSLAELGPHCVSSTESNGTLHL